MRVHLNLPTLDLPAALRFYSALLGEGPDKEREGFARFAPAGVPIALSLTAVDQLPDNETQRHLGLRAEGEAELAEAWARLRRAGLLREVVQADTCCWATQDKGWAVDPDGREWEVYTVTDDAPGASRSAASACCAPSEAPAGPACCP
ncbi:MAG: VOC family protein [Alphaproteobacteria bacterium]|nr:VOC family protein [Alphaproteobacteria bacterium]MCB9791478.1 VOC family protein [Alphaproteobacteria bacterium]